MTFTEEQVEWIVIEVIRRLGLAASGEAQDSTAGELTLRDKVITMRTIEGRLEGVKRLVVHTRAVVTPAVRDEVKTRKIELVFGEGEHSSTLIVTIPHISAD